MSRGSSGQTERFPSEAISRTQVAFGRNCLTRRMFSFFLGRSMNSSPANDSLSQAAVLLRRTSIREGKPFPLGANWDGLGVNFALFSAHATKVELCLFDDTGEKELERIELPEYTDEVWHGYLPTARDGVRLSRSRSI